MGCEPMVSLPMGSLPWVHGPMDPCTQHGPITMGSLPMGCEPKTEKGL